MQQIKELLLRDSFFFWVLPPVSNYFEYVPSARRVKLGSTIIILFKRDLFPTKRFRVLTI